MAAADRQIGRTAALRWRSPRPEPIMALMTTDDFGRSPLHYAALDGEVALVQTLLAAGSDINARDRDDMTALHFAAQDYRCEVVTILLAAGAAIDAVDRFGNTPLSTAVMHSAGRIEVVAALLSAGADPDRQNNYGISPRELIVDSPPDELHTLIAQY